jgi:hypothetical protein
MYLRNKETAMATKTEAELEALTLDQIRELAFQEQVELEAAEKAEKEAADKVAAEKAAAEVTETPEQIAEREAAEQAAAEQEAAEKEALEHPRDAQGRFTKKEDIDREAAEKAATETAEQEAAAKAAEEAEGNPDEWIIRREIDLGDGAGVEVFEGRGETELDAIKDLNDRLVVAKQSASRELRNIQRKHPKEPEPPKEQEISEDLEFVFKEQLGKKPSEAFKAMFKEVTGVDIAEFKTTHAAMKAWQESTAATEKSLAIQREFVAAHPEYIISQENGDQMRDWVREHNYNEFTPENLEKAFDDLSVRGLLTLKTDGASVPTKTEVTTKVKETTRIEPPATEVVKEVTPVRSPRKASSVSTTRSAAPVVKTELTEDEMYALPKEELLKRANAQLAEQNRAQ